MIVSESQLQALSKYGTFINSKYHSHSPRCRQIAFKPKQSPQLSNFEELRLGFIQFGTWKIYDANTALAAGNETRPECVLDRFAKGSRWHQSIKGGVPHCVIS